MFGCSRQKYGNSPASVNVCSNVAAGAIIPESNLPSGVTFSPDVAVCGCASSFVHVIVSPTLTWTGFGWNASLVKVEEPAEVSLRTYSPFCGSILYNINQIVSSYNIIRRNV
jgi:hypothetical protein